MARGLNTLLMAGTLTRAPELRYTPGGLAILEMHLAGNDHVIGDDNQQRELAWYHRATTFGNAAETLSNQLEAGSAVFLEGRLDYRSWETPEGQRRSALDIRALRVEVLSYGPRKEEPTVVDVKGQQRLRNALNEVVIIGNLTRDAELRYTPSGSAVTRFSVAVNERFRDRSGADQERTHYVDVNVWRELAEACGELTKGDPVLVIGRLVNDSWADQEGNRRYTTRIEGSRVEYLSRGPASGGSGTRPEQPTQSDRTSQLDIDEEFPPEEDLPF
ncbi:MAG: single-stranded DNA-binding protein [Trueperaceae bacterium]|nr:MAG: single-stranded DNA-binding protein [Trueperaceae bacterium]